MLRAARSRAADAVTHSAKDASVFECAKSPSRFARPADISFSRCCCSSYILRCSFVTGLVKHTTPKRGRERRARGGGGGDSRAGRLSPVI